MRAAPFVRRLAVLATVVGLTAGGCILGPKQDDPTGGTSLTDQDSGMGGGFDSSAGDAAPPSCPDDGTHAHEVGPGFDACTAPSDSASDVRFDTTPSDTSPSDTIAVDDAPSDGGDAEDAGDGGDAVGDTNVDDAATGD